MVAPEMVTLREWSACARLASMSTVQMSVAPRLSTLPTGRGLPSTVTVIWGFWKEAFWPLPPIVTDHCLNTQGQGTNPAGGQAVLKFAGIAACGKLETTYRALLPPVDPEPMVMRLGARTHRRWPTDATPSSSTYPTIAVAPE